MFDAKFAASNGQSFAFGYAAGVLYSIDPLGDLPVELETSQGYQQVGATVESRSISGVTRTITGRILRNADYCKRQLRDVFAPYVTGRLTVAGKYYCDAEVQRCPAISAASRWPTFSFQLYCPNPYWHSVAETSAATLQITPAFTLPVCYETHQYGLRSQTEWLKIYNAGLDTQDFTLTLTAHGTVENPAVRDPETGEYLRFVVTLEDAEQLRIWREHGRLRIEWIIGGTAVNGFSLLDESSTLWTLRHGTQAWARSADSGADKLYLTVSCNAAFSTVITEVAHG
ncbi:MAG: hypothetical protein ACI4JC_03850 [Faecalibacterium sp.]